MEVAKNSSLISKAGSIEIVKIILGAFLLFAGAQIAIPLKPVPIVMTTVAVMLLGLLYQRGTAVKAVVLYVLAGAVGIPVFQGLSGGFAILKGPTAGYIFGFFCAVIAMTTLREKFGLESFFGVVVNCLVGTSLIFIPGILWLSLLIGFRDAVLLGFLPFLLPGLLKALLLSAAISFINPRWSGVRK